MGRSVVPTYTYDGPVQQLDCVTCLSATKAQGLYTRSFNAAMWSELATIAVHRHMHTHIHTVTHIHTLTYTLWHTHTHTLWHTHTHTQTHTHTCTHTLSFSLSLYLSLSHTHTPFFLSNVCCKFLWLHVQTEPGGPWQTFSPTAGFALNPSGSVNLSPSLPRAGLSAPDNVDKQEVSTPSWLGKQWVVMYACGIILMYCSTITARICGYLKTWWSKKSTLTFWYQWTKTPWSRIVGIPFYLICLWCSSNSAL